MKLNIGCGAAPVSGAINMDLFALWNHVDVIADCEVKDFGLPFRSNSFKVVYISHLLEHIVTFLPLMEEIHRITVPGGFVHIWVPYYRYEGAYHDPTHVRFFAERSFDIFSPDYKYNYYTSARYHLVTMKLNIVQKTSVPSIAKRLMKYPIPMRRFFNNFLWNLYSEIFYKLEVIK